MARLLALALIVLLSGGNVWAQGMTIADAYKAIPHAQTTFNPGVGKMPVTEKVYLQKLFNLVDLAIVERIQALQWVASRGEKGKPVNRYLADIEGVLGRLRSLQPPAKVSGAHRLILEAISEQRDYFRETGKNPYNPRHPKIQSSHGKLYAAYQQLMGVYPAEAAHNKQAFFDHLCALDFI